MASRSRQRIATPHEPPAVRSVTPGRLRRALQALENKQIIKGAKPSDLHGARNSLDGLGRVIAISLRLKP
jgi:hypothetical protein